MTDVTTTLAAVSPQVPFAQSAGGPGPWGPLDVLVLPQRNIQAHPKNTLGLWHLPVAEVLARQFDTDAHFVQYQSPSCQRLSRKSLQLGFCPTLVVSAFDVDCEAAHKSGNPAPDAWWQLEEPKVYELMSNHAGGAHYRTRGGYRLVFALPQPMVISTEDDERRWSSYYLRAVNYLRRQFGIHADPACKDWGRLFRAPHVVRVGGG